MDFLGRLLIVAGISLMLFGTGCQVKYSDDAVYSSWQRACNPDTMSYSSSTQDGYKKFEATCKEKIK